MRCVPCPLIAGLLRPAFPGGSGSELGKPQAKRSHPKLPRDEPVRLPQVGTLGKWLTPPAPPTSPRPAPPLSSPRPRPLRPRPHPALLWKVGPPPRTAAHAQHKLSSTQAAVVSAGGRQLPGDREPREDVRSGRTRAALQPLLDCRIRLQKGHCVPRKGSENTPWKPWGQQSPRPGGPAAAGRTPGRLRQLSIQLRRENAGPRGCWCLAASGALDCHPESLGPLSPVTPKRQADGTVRTTEEAGTRGQAPGALPGCRDTGTGRAETTPLGSRCASPLPPHPSLSSLDSPRSYRLCPPAPPLSPRPPPGPRPWSPPVHSYIASRASPLCPLPWLAWPSIAAT